MAGWADWITGAAGSSLDMVMDSISQGKSLPMNMALQKHASDLQLANWEAMTQNTRNWNEYAEKANKMMEAGLNPLFSEGQAPQAVISSSAPGVPSLTPSSSNTFSELARMMFSLNADKLKATTRKDNAEAENMETHTGILKEVRQTNIDQALANLEKTKSETEEHKSQKEYIDSGIMKNYEEVHARWRELDLEYLKYEFMRDNTKWQNEHIYEPQAQANMVEAEAAKMNASTNAYNAKKAGERIDAEVKKMAQETDSLYKTTLSNLAKNSADILNTLVKTDVAAIPLMLHKSLGGNIGQRKEQFEQMYGPEMIGYYDALVQYSKTCPPSEYPKVTQCIFKVGEAMKNCDPHFTPLPPFKATLENNYNMPWSQGSSY